MTKQTQKPTYTPKGPLRLGPMLGPTLGLTLALLLGLPLCQPLLLAAQPIVTQGVIDLRDAPVQSGERLALKGEYLYYYDTAASPQIINTLEPNGTLPVPGTWKGTPLPNGQEAPTKGRVTYRLRVLLNPAHYPEPLALRVGSIRQAYRLYINGQLMVESGNINPGQYTEQIMPHLITLPAADTLDIIVQAANKNFYKAGIIDAPQLGYASTLQEYQHNNRILDLFLVGCLIIMGLYHLIIFFIFKRFSPALYFGIICMLLGIRAAITNEAILIHLFPQFPTWLQMRLEYGSLYLSPLCIGLFFKNLYPREVPNWLLWVVGATTVVLGVSLLLPNDYYFGSLLWVGQLQVLLLGPVVIFYSLLLATFRRHLGAPWFLLGYAFFLFSGINDILRAMNLIETPVLTPVGLLLLVIAQSAALALRFARNFNTVEDLGKNLETKVEERTQELDRKTGQLAEQKDEIHKKHTSMMASLHYARRIQRAILGNEERLAGLFAQSFILFKPSQLVSGDFYWYGQVSTWKFVIVADCVEQGVPGAFVTVISNSLLNQIIMEQGETDAQRIVSTLDTRLQEVLQIESRGDFFGGVNLSLLAINEAEGQVQYAGANHSLIYRRGQDLFRLDGAPYSVGNRRYDGVEKAFTVKRLAWQPADAYYLFSEGAVYHTQGVKPMRAFEQMLNETAQGSMAEQKEALKAAIEQRQQAQGNRTDVLVVGVQV